MEHQNPLNPWFDEKQKYAKAWEDDKLRNPLAGQYNTTLEPKKIDPNEERSGPQQFVPKVEEGLMLGSTYEHPFTLECFFDLMDPVSAQSLEIFLTVVR